MGRLIVSNAMTLNAAFEAPEPEPSGWLVLHPDSQQGSLDQWLLAEAMVLGRKTYEGLAAVWPQTDEGRRCRGSGCGGRTAGRA